MRESLPIPFREAGAPPNSLPLLLFFREEPIQNQKETEAQGAPIFDCAHVLRIVVPGSNGDAPEYRIARVLPNGTSKTDDAGAFHRFREPYEAWLKGQNLAQGGTPLEEWPLMTVGNVAAMKAQNIFTVQMLAEVTDAACDRMRGLREWRGKAQAWLATAKDAAGDVQARAELARANEQIKALQEQVSQLLQSQNKPTLGYDAPKRGRKKTEPASDDIVIPEEEEVRL